MPVLYSVRIDSFLLRYCTLMFRRDNMDSHDVVPLHFDCWYKPKPEEVRRFRVHEQQLEGGYFTVLGRTYVLPVLWDPSKSSYVSFSSFSECDPTVHSCWAQVDSFLRNQDVYLMMPGVANLPHPPPVQR